MFVSPLPDPKTTPQELIRLLGIDHQVSPLVNLALHNRDSYSMLQMIVEFAMALGAAGLADAQRRGVLFDAENAK
jgi:hypothetical protein